MPITEASHVQLLAEAALAVPLAHALGARLIDESDPSRGCWSIPGRLADNGAGGVHASALDVLVELAGFLAVAPSLAEQEHAITHSSAVQLVSSASWADRVEARGTVDRRGHRIAFVSVLATVDGTTIARAQLTKSIVSKS